MLVTKSMSRIRQQYVKTFRGLQSLSVLSTVPEFKEALDFDKQGKFGLSAPLYQRTHEVTTRLDITYSESPERLHHRLKPHISSMQVISSCTGVSSDMSVYVALRLAKSHMHAGHHTLAEKQLSIPPFAEPPKSGDGVMTVIKARQLMTTMLLLKGDSVGATKFAEEALELSEGQDSSAIDISVHSTCYGLRGY